MKEFLLKDNNILKKLTRKWRKTHTHTKNLPYDTKQRQRNPTQSKLWESHNEEHF